MNNFLDHKIHKFHHIPMEKNIVAEKTEDTEERFIYMASFTYTLSLQQPKLPFFFQISRQAGHFYRDEEFLP